MPNAALRWSPSSLAEVAPDARNGNLIDPPGEVTTTNALAQKHSNQTNSRRTLWIKRGEYVWPIEVTAGISDGAITAVHADGLREGDEVVTGEIVTSAADVKNPFLPKFIRR